MVSRLINFKVIIFLFGYSANEGSSIKNSPFLNVNSNLSIEYDIDYRKRYSKHCDFASLTSVGWSINN